LSLRRRGVGWLSATAATAIDRLAPKPIGLDATPLEIAELRLVAGTPATTDDADLATAPSVNATAASNVWTEEPKDGRIVEVVRRPLSERDEMKCGSWSLRRGSCSASFRRQSRQ
jgi:hypothetical protein